MTASQNITVRLGDWAQLQADATPIRFEVFVQEQDVPPELEMDDMDVHCLHAVAYAADGRPLGTGRLLPDGHIGRMAVRREARGTGLGGKLLTALIEAGRARGHRELVLNAQSHAIAFYERYGFLPHGEEFQEAGIPHVTMTRTLA